MRRLALIAIIFSCGPALAQDRSSDFDDKWQVYAHNLLRDSIAFRSVHGQKQVVPLAKYLALQFTQNGFDEADVQVLPMDSNGEPAASLVVRYHGSSDKPAILFAAHMDVVDAANENWGRDPFQLTEEDGYYYGRGVLDDKFGTTVLTTTFLRLKSEGFTPERDLIIAFTGDEETKQETIQELVNDHLDLIDAEFAMNVDAGAGRLNESFDPVIYRLQYAEKTYASFELTTRSPGGHSAMPNRDNAIFRLADAVKALQSYQFPARSSDEVREYFKTVGSIRDDDVGKAMLRFAENPDDGAASDLLSDYPDYVGTVRTTCIPTMLRGGHAENALPESATVTVNCRIYPGIEVADVESQLRSVVNDPGLEIRGLGEPTSSPASVVRDDVVAILQGAVNQLYPGTPVIPYMAPFATDGTYLRRAGIPTYGSYGLFLRAEDDLMHASGEKLPISGFYQALKHWHFVIPKLAAL